MKILGRLNYWGVNLFHSIILSRTVFLSMKLERINEIERTAGNLVDATARRVLINLRVGIVVFGTNISSRSYIFHFESWAAVAVDAAVGVVE